MTVHRCQVVALDGCRFNPNFEILIAVKLMDVIVTPSLNRPATPDFIKKSPTTVVNKLSIFG